MLVAVNTFTFTNVFQALKNVSVKFFANFNHVEELLAQVNVGFLKLYKFVKKENFKTVFTSFFKKFTKMNAKVPSYA